LSFLQPTFLFIAAAVVVAAAPVLSQKRAAEEDVARLQFENGRGHMRRGNYEEALKDFHAVAELYPDSALAGNARLEMSRYYLEIGDEPALALKEADEILKRYATSDSAPYAYLVQGEVVLAHSRRKADLDKAVATFDRVPGIYPGTDAVPRARYLAAEAVRLSHEPLEALQRYRQLAAAHPRDSIISKVHIGTGMALAAIGETVDAMEEFQFARGTTDSREDSDAALARLSVLYRLYVKPPQIGAFTYSNQEAGLPGRASDVHRVLITPRGAGYFTTKSAVIPFDPLRVDPLPALVKPRGLTIDRAGRLVVIDAGTLMRRGASPVPLSMAQGTSVKPFDDAEMAVSFKSGDWLVAAQDDRGIQRFASNGKHLGTFAIVKPSRLAINEFDEVAVLERDNKAIKILDESGKPVASIPQRGPGYELKNPVDISYDALGHLYVLDRTGVFVFIPGAKGAPVVRTFSEPETSPGALRRAAAFALDPFGRMYVADDRVERIRVYQ
jgi:tetratricopeptide (TPR) repeat protein